MPAADTVRVVPPAPATLAETGVGLDMVQQLAAKVLLFAGELGGADLAARLGVRFGVVEPALDLLKRGRHCEVAGGGLLGPPSYRYRLTDAGRTRATMFVEQSQYVGPVPVPIDQYTAYMRAFRAHDATTITREAVGRAFTHLVLGERLLDQLGPAISARHSLFIYGPPGNGKTVIAQAIRNLLAGQIAVPHALSIDGHVVRIFDPVNHERAAGGAPAAGLDGDTIEDGRWVRCRRPMVMAGGELTLAALELGRAGTGLYRAPLQALANGGVLVVDDFGRQHATPADLLNRWIVPLETRIDYLTLDTGQKFALPFDVFVVFATNLKPADLVDEAFLRRIRYKVFAESPTPADFVRIFENYCADRQIPFEPSLAETLLERELGPRGVQLRGCQPRDLIDQALSLAAYLGRPGALTLDLLQMACASYFVDDTEHASA